MWFRALAGRPGVFWLDSGPSAGHHARYHHLGSDPIESVTGTHRTLLELPADRHDLPCVPRWLVVLPYDAAVVPQRALAAVLDALPEELGSSAGFRCRYDAVISFDLVERRAFISADSPEARDRLLERLTASAAPLGSAYLHSLTSEPTEALRGQIARVKAAIARGDVYQVNLSRRFEASLEGHPSELYLALRQRRPAPMGAYVQLPEAAILSNSPEVLLTTEPSASGATVSTWPLKGTRPAHGDAAELLASEKDRAEHVMIVDLERNDLGRVAVPGSVSVPRFLEVVRHPTVMHLESEVRCECQASLGEVLDAVFPGGSITGAPKLAAMAEIAASEGRRRGVYCGAIGIIDADARRSRWSIPIRTGVAAGGRFVFRSGGGIVSDSDADSELLEMETKARAVLELLAH